MQRVFAFWSAVWDSADGRAMRRFILGRGKLPLDDNWVVEARKATNAEHKEWHEEKCKKVQKAVQGKGVDKKEPEF